MPHDNDTAYIAGDRVVLVKSGVHDGGWCECDHDEMTERIARQGLFEWTKRYEEATILETTLRTRQLVEWDDQKDERRPRSAVPNDWIRPRSIFPEHIFQPGQDVIVKSTWKRATFVGYVIAESCHNTPVRHVVVRINDSNKLIHINNVMAMKHNSSSRIRGVLDNVL